MSCTVIVAEAVLWLLWMSVTVRVTVLVPRSSQSKSVWLRDKVNVPQASVVPRSTSAVVRVASPFPSRLRVKSWAEMVGAVVSSMVKVAVVDVLSQPSLSSTSSTEIETTSSVVTGSPNASPKISYM